MPKILESKKRIKNIDKAKLPKNKKPLAHYKKMISTDDDDNLQVGDIATIVITEDENGKPLTFETRELNEADFEDVNA